MHIANNEKKTDIENNDDLLCMHAVFMGMPTASRSGGGGDASLQSDGARNQKW